MKNALLAVLLLTPSIALAQPQQSPTGGAPATDSATKTAPKTTITFGKGTTVMVNGQPVQSGYQLQKGDKLTVSGGNAEIKYVTAFGERTKTLGAGTTVAVGNKVSSSGQISFDIIGTVDGKQSTLMTATLESSLVMPPPPAPNPIQNTSSSVSPSSP